MKILLRFVSYVLLFFFYFFVITPPAILMKLFGKDLMGLKRNANNVSYWKPRTKSVKVKSFFSQRL